MSELLREYTRVTDQDGLLYTAKVYGRISEDGHWEATLGFVPDAGGAEMRTGSETEQASREDLEYWASGLTEAYLEGALERARERR